MKLSLSQAAALFAAGLAATTAFAQEGGTASDAREHPDAPEYHSNAQMFAGAHQEGPCAGAMGNGAPCVTDLLGYPIDIYRADWSAADRAVFWDTQFTDTGKRLTVTGFTDVGFKKMAMPAAMRREIMAHYHSLPDVPEPHLSGYINNADDGNSSSSNGVAMYTREWTVVQRDMILAHMAPILEEWVGGRTTLEYTSIFGVRVYTNGSMLMNHADRADTHAVSAILNLVQEGVRTPWPLAIMGSDGLTHEVTMEAGEMILYESARLAHGRPHALDGDRYCNGFVHMRPTGHEWPEMIGRMRQTQTEHGEKRRAAHEQYHALRRKDEL